MRFFSKIFINFALKQMIGGAHCTDNVDLSDSKYTEPSVKELSK